jgi:hypothetical protein
MQTEPEPKPEPFHAARFIKEIGRGVKGARSMSRERRPRTVRRHAGRRVSDLELGAILLAMRIKGESVEEIAGFMDAAEQLVRTAAGAAGSVCAGADPQLQRFAQAGQPDPAAGPAAGARGRAGADPRRAAGPGRVTTAEILAEMGIGPTGSSADMLDAFAAGQPCFMPIETLAPQLAGQLALRRILGVRNSTHTLVKILQPFDGPALRLVSYTHPEYLTMLTEYFRTAAPAGRGDAFLMRGTEGETVANANRAQQIDWFHAASRPCWPSATPPPTNWRRRRKGATPPPPPTGSCAPCAANSRCRRRSRPRPRTACAWRPNCVLEASNNPRMAALHRFAVRTYCLRRRALPCRLCWTLLAPSA